MNRIAKKEILPIGSVIKIEGIPNLIMIYGRKVSRNEENVNYDYVGCPYPLGFITIHQNIFFNHNDISTIIFKGYENHEEKLLKIQLN